MRPADPPRRAWRRAYGITRFLADCRYSESEIYLSAQFEVGTALHIDPYSAPAQKIAEAALEAWQWRHPGRQ